MFFCIDWGAGIWEYEGVAGVTKNLFAGDVVKGVISVLLMKIPRIA